MGLQKYYKIKFKYFIASYSIHAPGWLLKWLNLITAPGSVSNEPDSVTWLATKYLKTVSWRNHTEKLTTLWLQNISFWSKINIPSSYFTIVMLNCLENTVKLLFDIKGDSCQILDLINFQNNLTWPTLLESVQILGWNTVKLLTGMQKKPLHSLGSCTENFPLIQISSILSVNFLISPVLWHKCQTVFWLGQLHLSKACWELWLSDDQPHSDYNGQWQMALCVVAVLQSSLPNPQRN